ncbi:MAG TPA: hypothetical protein VKE88_02710 [Candidatus Nanoarchaeia archaeon]|nr:hypothetical protein [Candidatus Nanoarchaeia archaeon]
MTLDQHPDVKDDFWKHAVPCTLSADVDRDMLVADLKGEHTKEYLLKHGLVTLEEYERVPAHNFEKEARREELAASLMHQIPGYEKY